MATPEGLAARYKGRWVITCDLNWDGTRGDWTAEPCQPGKDERITARTVGQLAEQLQQAAGGGHRG